MEFKAFDNIARLEKIEMTITQKIHGTNAKITILEYSVADMMPSETGVDVIVDGKQYRMFVGSRTRWITPEHDNYGFATFVYSNAEEFIRKFGLGEHNGEWAGPGINSGEGLKQKTFVLFDWWKFPAERELPPQTAVVPVLYRGSMFRDDTANVPQAIMADLKANGSRLVPGFMRPEGVVMDILGQKIKAVFQAEETGWKKPDKEKVTREAVATVDISHLLQPIRMEKLLSRDETYMKEFPKSLPKLCSDYVADLEKENQFDPADETIKKALGGRVFGFAKAMVIRQTKMQDGSSGDGNQE